MILYLDTTSADTVLRLYNQEGRLLDEHVWESCRNQSEELLEKVDGLLKKNGIDLKDLKKIAVNRGPGSYTGQRIGITTANFIAFSLNIPIIGIENGATEEISKKTSTAPEEFDCPVLPLYLKPPHITTPKRQSQKR